MKILLINDDGVEAPGLRVLAEVLSQVATVVVVAPDREQSAIGTAVTLRRALHLTAATAAAPGVVTWAVDGTPGDAVILGLGKVFPEADMVIAGINSGHNMGDDVMISGTVAAAMQGYLRGYPAGAVSVAEPRTYPQAAEVALALAEIIAAGKIPPHVFLNVNVPDLPPDLIREAQLTSLVGESHVDTVSEVAAGEQLHYHLVRGRAQNGHSPGSDIMAVAAGHVSVTPLHRLLLRRPGPDLNDADFAALTAIFRG